MSGLADYEWLTGPEAARCLEEVAKSTEPVHRQLGRLRKILSADRASLVVGQIELRQRAVAKFGELAAKMFFNEISLQQATDLQTARYKASRLPRDSALIDYCCGIGGDLLAMAKRGPTTGWDRAPEVAQLANANLQAFGNENGSRALVGEVELQTPPQDAIWHLDPDRRNDGRRSTQIEWHSPGPKTVERWLKSNNNGMLKLAPAARVPSAWTDQAELEWISFDRQCRQLVVWFGNLVTAAGQRRVTKVGKNSDEETASFVGSPNCSAPVEANVLGYVYDTDPAIRAAGLTDALANDQSLAALGSGAAYLTSDTIVSHPLLSRFEVLEVLPLRTKTLSKHLLQLDIGQLEIKKRGVDVDPERLRKEFKLRGDQSATLLLTQKGQSEIAILARRNEG